MKIYIKYMVSNQCILVVKEMLNELRIPYKGIQLGYIDLRAPLTDGELAHLRSRLLQTGLELLDNPKSVLIEKIKVTIINMVHYNEELPAQNYSVYIEDKLGYDYNYLATTFSEVKGVTIQQFIINNKIERTKELLLYNELTLTYIAFKLGYSSVAHLSSQFKKVTGLTPSFFKSLKANTRKNLENL